MKIDCLCITTSHRKSFKNWLIWNYTKQSHTDKNLIVISDDDDWPDWVDYRYAAVDEPIPVKRNMALSAASGDAVSWFDDDDWQHVNKLKIISENVELMTIVGCGRSFFYDLTTGLVARVELGTMPIFNSTGLMRYGLPAFAERMVQYSDTDWMNKLLVYRSSFISDTLLFFWITHKHNISNPITKIRPVHKLDYYLDGETWQNLKKLEVNLKLG